MDRVEKYGIFELKLDVPKQDRLVIPCATFQKDGKPVPVSAFWSQDGYTVRFMPRETGIWRYEANLDGKTLSGSFSCEPNTGNNHGPVVTEGFRFRYDDGEKYLPFGTTCYAWTHQPTELQEQTLETLKQSPFNKIRMCVFPKSMPYNNNDPELYPYARLEDGSWDLTDPDERSWRLLERRLTQLAELGIEADLILLHPYDRWGFSRFTMEQVTVYLEYCVARLGSFRNVWWSLANEFDFIPARSFQDWDDIGAFIAANDRDRHLTGIHNGFVFYPKKDWMTHCSIQSGHVEMTPLWRSQYQLPVIVDESGYEGDLEYDWGNLSAFEHLHRIWTAVTRGGFATHGETFHREDEVLWWAKGGPLYGESPDRIQFLKNLMYSLPQDLDLPAIVMGLTTGEMNPEKMPPEHAWFAQMINALPKETREQKIMEFVPSLLASDDCRLQYFGRSCRVYADFDLPENGKYRIETIDIWEMTRTVFSEDAHGKTRVALPGKEGSAVLVTRLEGDSLK